MPEGISNIQIRMALEDTAAIASVLYQSFAEYKPLYTDEAFAATAATSDQIQQRMSEGPVWVALQNETIVGTVSAVSKGHDLYIRGMAILPIARGQGIGELLLNEIESFARRQSYQRLLLSTTPFLTRAIRLYERTGFRRSSEGPHDLFGTPLFSMVKVLQPSVQRQ
jgi:ribosomal protein S18 acetylase RimI-like enzyme